MLAHLKTSKTLTYIPDIAELPGRVQVPCQVSPGLKPELNRQPHILVWMNGVGRMGVGGRCLTGQNLDMELDCEFR